MSEKAVEEIEGVLQEQGLGSLSTVFEVAKALKCHKSVIYDAIKRGDLEVVRLGSKTGHSRITITAVARWLTAYSNYHPVEK